MINTKFFVKYQILYFFVFFLFFNLISRSTYIYTMSSQIAKVCQKLQHFVLRSDHSIGGEISRNHFVKFLLADDDVEVVNACNETRTDVFLLFRTNEAIGTPDDKEKLLKKRITQILKKCDGVEMSYAVADDVFYHYNFNSCFTTPKSTSEAETETENSLKQYLSPENDITPLTTMLLQRSKDHKDSIEGERNSVHMIMCQQTDTIEQLKEFCNYLSGQLHAAQQSLVVLNDIDSQICEMVENTESAILKEQRKHVWDYTGAQIFHSHQHIIWKTSEIRGSVENETFQYLLTQKQLQLLETQRIENDMANKIEELDEKSKKLWQSRLSEA